MNANEKIFALALASNAQPEQHLTWAIQFLRKLGTLQLSKVYQIPCRDGVGADYLNCACLLRCNLSYLEIQKIVKEMEILAGRVRPSHRISLDIDLIAWGYSLSNLTLNQKKMPFALDVKIPLFELIGSSDFAYEECMNYPEVILPLHQEQQLIVMS